MGSSSRGSGLSGRNCLRESHYRITGDYNLQINPPEEEPEPEIAIPKIEIAVGETTELTTDSSSDNISWGSTDPSEPAADTVDDPVVTFDPVKRGFQRIDEHSAEQERDP